MRGWGAFLESVLKGWNRLERWNTCVSRPTLRTDLRAFGLWLPLSPTTLMMLFGV